MATAWCRNALRKQEARGGENVGGFLKEAPKPPRTFLEFIFDRTNALRQSHAESLFQSQFNAARVQPPGFSRRTPQRQGQPETPGGKPPPGACFSGSACAASDSVPGYLHGSVNRQRRGASPRRVPASQVQPVPQTVKCRGAGSGSPRQNNLRVSPFPAGEERSASAGRGDILPLRGRGAESKLKAGQAGGQKRKPPMQTSQRQVKPIPQKTKGNTENSTQSTVDNPPGFML